MVLYIVPSEAVQGEYKAVLTSGDGTSRALIDPPIRYFSGTGVLFFLCSNVALKILHPTKLSVMMLLLESPVSLEEKCCKNGEMAKESAGSSGKMGGRPLI